MRPTDKHLQTHSFESSSHSASLLCGLNQLRKEGLLFDVTLLVGGQRFCAHRTVLAACSEYFRAMFTDAMKESQQDEVTLNGITSTGFRCLLDFAYTSELTLNLSNIQSVLGAASHLQMFSVVEACSRYLKSQLDLDNCIDILNLTETYTLANPRKAVFCFIGQNLAKVMWTSEFQRLTGEQLLHLLGKQYPLDCKECTVLQAVLHWVNYGDSTRGAFLTPLLRLVHYNTMEVWEVERAKRHRLIATSTDALSMIAQAMWIRRGNRAVSVPGLLNPRGFEKVMVTVGGFRAQKGMTNDLTYYHPRSKQWKQLTSITHVDQCNFGVAVLRNEVYVVGGCFNSQSLQEQIHPFGFKYSPKTDTWSSIDMMEDERCRFCLVELHGKLYAIGGMKEHDVFVEEAACEVYNPEEDAWSSTRPVPYNVARHAGVALDGEIYISGGCGLNEEVLDYVFAYSAQNDAWTRKAPLLSPRVDHCMVAYDHRLLVAGGWNEESGSRTILDNVDSFDTLTGQWQVVTRMRIPRYNMGAVVSGHVMLLMGGHRWNGFSKTCRAIEKYCLGTGEWADSEEYPTEIWEHASCELYVPTYREDETVVVS